MPLANSTGVIVTSYPWLIEVYGIVPVNSSQSVRVPTFDHVMLLRPLVLTIVKTSPSISGSWR